MTNAEIQQTLSRMFGSSLVRWRVEGERLYIALNRPPTWPEKEAVISYLYDKMLASGFERYHEAEYISPAELGRHIDERNELYC